MNFGLLKVLVATIRGRWIFPFFRVVDEGLTIGIEAYVCKFIDNKKKERKKKNDDGVARG